ncbi:MAG TPA: carboxypeptidase-like regulatory domain-containing protein [Terracidiphilus sp.]
MRHRRASLLATAFAALLAGIVLLGTKGTLLVPAAQAQNIGERTVSGAVLDADSDAVVGATVFLRSEKTKSIRSYTSTAEGHFHFAQVNMAEDFDLWAEKGGKKSAVKTVSSWDARKDFISDLKLK